MIRKRFFISLSLIFLIFLLSFSKSYQDLALIYSFEDRKLENISGTGKTQLSLSRDVAFTGDYSLKISNRDSIWDGISLNLTYNVENNKNYEIRVMVYQNSNKPRLIQLFAYTKDLSQERIQVISERVIMPNIWKELSGEFRVNYSGYLEDFKLFLVSPNDTDYDIYIDDLKVLGESKIEIPGLLLRSTFESGTLEDWEARGSNVKLIPTNEVSYEGNYSLKISGRNKTWNGPQIDIKNLFKPNKHYEISIWVYHKEKNTQYINLSLQRRNRNEKESKFENLIYQKPIPPNTWVEIRKPYNVPYNADYDELILYLESSNPALEFYIDNLRISERIMNDLELEVPSLKDIYKDYFKIGFMVSYPKLVVSKEAQIIAKKHLTSLTSGNDFKPENLQKREGEFTFEIADEYVKFAEENNIALRGHTLVWHQQTPDWFFEDKDKRLVSKEVLLKRLENHIKTVVGRYRGKMYAWDVVNEAIDPSQPDGYRRNKWFEIIGPEYIEKAFLWAHEADPSAKLFYNDYDTENPRKRQLIYNLVKNLKEKGIPIHGIGIQGHINIERPSVSEMEETIKLFSSIPGIEIHITELDISVYTKAGVEYERPHRELMIIQAHKYKEIFQMLKKYKGIVTSVTIAGIRDDHSWYSEGRGRNDYPLLFDQNYRTKLSFWAIVEPSVLPPLTKYANFPKGIVEVDGREDEIYKTINPLEISINEKSKALVKTLWSSKSIFIYAEILDDTKDPEDSLSIFIDQNNSKTFFLQRDDIFFTFYRNGNLESNFNPALRGYKILEGEKGYFLEAEITIFGTILEKGQKIGFDIILRDNKNLVSWSDTSNSQENCTIFYGTLELEEGGKIAIAKKGMPIIDGEKEDIWEKTLEYITESYVLGEKGKVAFAKFRVLWDEENIYVWAEVYDSLLNKDNPNPWEQDSLEIFIDEDNSKKLSYDSNDSQFRVNFENKQSFGTNGSEDRFLTAVKITSWGYIVEAKVKMKEVRLEKDKIIGFDIQINDADILGGRVGIIAWNETANENWRNPSYFGNIKLSE